MLFVNPPIYLVLELNWELLSNDISLPEVKLSCINIKLNFEYSLGKYCSFDMISVAHLSFVHVTNFVKNKF